MTTNENSENFGQFAVPPPPLPSTNNSDYFTISNRDQESLYSRDQNSFFSDGSGLQKINQGCAHITDLGLCKTDDQCDSLDINDIGLSFESSYEMFGNSQGQPRYNCEDGRIASQLMEKNLYATESNSTLIESAMEASSSGQQDFRVFHQPLSKITAGSSNLMQTSSSANFTLMNPAAACNRSGLGFPDGQLPSTISLSLFNITGESCAAVYQDYVLSPVFLKGDNSLWESNLEASCPRAREKAKIRYNEKKKKRKYIFFRSFLPYKICFSQSQS